MFGLGVSYGSVRRNLLQARPLEAENVKKARRRGAKLLAGVGGLALGVGLCACFEIGAGVPEARPCTPGEAQCVCRDDLSCEQGLLCELNRCIPNAKSTPELTPATVLPEKSEEPASTTTGDKGGETPSVEPSESSQEDSSSDESTQEAGCTDGILNGQESDVDCGGLECSPCRDGSSCVVDIDCQSKRCQLGICVSSEDAECRSDNDCDDANPCSLDRCIAKHCEYQAGPDGVRCDDGRACTAQDKCRAGACEGRSTLVLEEFFERGKFSSSWTFGEDLEGESRTRWNVAPARASDCGAEGGWGEDPALDHSPGDRNGVAGVHIGGCHHHGRRGRWDCAWTAYFDVSFFEEKVLLTFWRHLHSPGLQKDGDRQKGVRNQVAYRFKGDGEIRKLFVYPDAGINDSEWTHQEFRLGFAEEEALKKQEVSFGVCYQRVGRVASFAGWSIDDARIRQAGCMEKL